MKKLTPVMLTMFSSQDGPEIPAAKQSSTNSNAKASSVAAEEDSAAPAKEGSTSLRQQFSQQMRESHRELLVYARAITGGDHHSAQDLVQDAFVTAYRKFADFDSEKGDFGAWMRGIVRNKCRDWFRKQKKTPLSDTDAAEIEVDIAAWQSAKAAGSGSVFEALEGCIENLPEKLKAAVQSFYFKGHTGDEAADQLAISPASLRKRLERAREQLHACISRKTQPQAQPST